MPGFVYITNKNDFDHQDQFDGVGYVFERDKPEVVPVEAAVHMFGFGMKDKTEALVRLGWANGGTPSIKRLAKFVITEAKFQPPPQEEKKEALKTQAEPVDPTPIKKPTFGFQRTEQPPKAPAAP